MDTEQKSILDAILIASLVVAVILGYFIVALIRQNRRNIKLYKEKMIAEVTTLENERKRMASDLHDELGPIVAGIKLKLNGLETESEDDHQILDRVQDNLADMILRMKSISNDLMPVILLKKGLLEAMNDSVKEINRSGSLKVILTHDQIPAINETVAINLYRIVQELIHNTLKHAKATELQINLGLVKNQLVMMTRDNGVGFNYNSELTEKGGRGLQNLSTRTEVLGGKMMVTTAPGEGTTYIFRIPIIN